MYRKLFRAHNNSDSNRPYRYEDSFRFGKETTTVTTPGNNNNIIRRNNHAFAKPNNKQIPTTGTYILIFIVKYCIIYVGERLKKAFAIMFFATFISHFETQLQKASKRYPFWLCFDFAYGFAQHDIFSRPPKIVHLKQANKSQIVSKPYRGGEVLPIKGHRPRACGWEEYLP